MERKDIAYSDVSRSLKRFESFIDEFLKTLRYYIKEHYDIRKSIDGFIDDVKFNREGDESINYIGIHNCVDFILNNSSILLAKRLFVIESKINEIEEILLPYIDKKETGDLLWETCLILGQINELYVEPFIQETNQSEIIPETGDIEGLSNKRNNKPMNEAQVMMSVENEPFEPLKNGKPIPYQKCFERLTEGKIRRSAGESELVEVINKQYSLELFQYCVDRADISKIFKSRKKSYAILFMNDIASFYEDSSAFRKAAAKALGVKKLGVGRRGTGINADYYNLMTGIFSKDVNYQKVKKKKAK